VEVVKLLVCLCVQVFIISIKIATIMKLLMCLSCGDIFNLTRKEKSCGCNAVKGKYTDASNAVYVGNAQPIGIANGSFRSAFLLQQHMDTQQQDDNHNCCIGAQFKSFFIPASARSLERLTDLDEENE
jgi:hypothetical protein